ncbi:MAG: DNA methyltransferase [Thermodesulfobacteriota bacterium]
MMRAEVYEGDCLEILKTLPNDSANLIYLDPPFFTQKVHSLRTRDRLKEFSFKDIWASHEEYIAFLRVRLLEMYRVLSGAGSIFFHCDRNSSHIARLLLDEIFGEAMFRSEIIWHYRRWSNAAASLLPAHQTVYYYTKSDSYTFNSIYEDYSPSTNVDQILQRRKRDEYGKSAYERSDSGEIVPNGGKKGVPLCDVWDIPYLNPKAKERVGYPTQKPILLLERIIRLASREGDLVLDPFCGSGTTVVTANMLRRCAVGIDISHEAVEITKDRLHNPEKSESNLLEKGRESYINADQEILRLLDGISFVPVQRNRGIDAILRDDVNGHPILVRIQRPHESLLDAANLLFKAAKGKSAAILFLVITNKEGLLFAESQMFPEITLVDAPSLIMKEIISRRKNLESARTAEKLVDIVI